MDAEPLTSPATEQPSTEEQEEEAGKGSSTAAFWNFFKQATCPPPLPAACLVATCLPALLLRCLPDLLLRCLPALLLRCFVPHSSALLSCSILLPPGFLELVTNVQFCLLLLQPLQLL